MSLALHKKLLAPPLTRGRFAAQVRGILGDTRLLWLPRAGDTTTSTTLETSTGRTVTWDATVAARLSALGRGHSQTFNGTDDYGTTPDAADLSFGDGSADQSFSLVALVNITDTAASREVMSKSGEWTLRVNATDKLVFILTDLSAGVFPTRPSTNAVTQGSWVLVGATYDTALGTGATAADGMAVYANGAAMASTASNNASYVAMENTATVTEIGSTSAGTGNFFSGSQALAAVCAKVLTAADYAALTALCRRYYGVPS